MAIRMSEILTKTHFLFARRDNKKSVVKSIAITPAIDEEFSRFAVTRCRQIGEDTSEASYSITSLGLESLKAGYPILSDKLTEQDKSGPLRAALPGLESVSSANAGEEVV